jgi:hypothetical protein
MVGLHYLSRESYETQNLAHKISGLANETGGGPKVHRISSNFGDHACCQSYLLLELSSSETEWMSSKVHKIPGVAMTGKTGGGLAVNLKSRSFEGYACSPSYPIIDWSYLEIE